MLEQPIWLEVTQTQLSIGYLWWKLCLRSASPPLQVDAFIHVKSEVKWETSKSKQNEWSLNLKQHLTTQSYKVPKKQNHGADNVREKKTKKSHDWSWKVFQVNTFTTISISLPCKILLALACHIDNNSPPPNEEEKERVWPRLKEADSSWEQGQEEKGTAKEECKLLNFKINQE